MHKNNFYSSAQATNCNCGGLTERQQAKEAKDVTASEAAELPAAIYYVARAPTYRLTAKRSHDRNS